MVEGVHLLYRIPAVGDVSRLMTYGRPLEDNGVEHSEAGTGLTSFWIRGRVLRTVSSFMKIPYLILYYLIESSITCTTVEFRWWCS